ncbi:hypothetical protein LCGC14_1941090 [marine sediment metagenome]|uniref:Uncharacterized protein n=1 Tax=marine sediment metagenome TaxID=412755 RepID=A0A0F9FKA0_9ZZZZ
MRQNREGSRKKRLRAMRVSFTASSQTSLTHRQRRGVLAFLQQHCTEITEIHLGDCINGDEQIHFLACSLNLWDLIILHPPSNPIKRAYCSAPTTCKPKPYLERNWDIARACDILLAAPQQAKEIIRSGTWATVRYSKQLGKTVIILNP